MVFKSYNSDRPIETTFELASKSWQHEQSRISDSKTIFKMKGMQQIARKRNTNIFRYRSDGILKLVTKNVKKNYKILLDIQ